MTVTVSVPPRSGHRRRVARLALAVGVALGIGGRATAGDIAAAGTPALQTVAAWVVATGDNHGTPFVIVDKVAAVVSVFDPAGTLTASAPALVGLARGDVSVPGVGSLPLARITPAQRTTPAGRFVGELGTDSFGHTILWVDYADAIALHAVVTSNPAEHRLARLASPSPADHRISYGCINVPAAFFATMVEPAFRPHGGIVYVLPEVRSLEAVFGIVPPAADPAQAAGTPPPTPPTVSK